MLAAQHEFVSLRISSPTSERSVSDRGVIEEPCSLDSVHPPALNAHCHPALLTYNHVWREDDP